MKEKDKPVQVEVVERLPDNPVLDKVIFNKEDKSFYLGVDDKED